MSSAARPTTSRSLRTIHDWVIKPKLRTVKGTAEATPGAATKSSTWSASIRPGSLKHGLTFEEVVEAVVRNNRNVGGGTTSAEQPNAAGSRRRPHRERRANRAISSLRQSRACPSACATWPMCEIGHEVRRGAVTADGRGEVVPRPGLHAHRREQPRSDPEPQTAIWKTSSLRSPRTSRCKPSTTARHWWIMSSKRCAITSSRAGCW